MIRLSRSDVGTAERQAVTGVLSNGYLGMGGEVGLFERELSEFLGGGHQVVCVNTGTAALHLGLQACGLGAGDEVLLPSLTYVASFQAVTATGARPVACDIDPESLTLNPEDMRRRITSRTKAVMPVHYASGPGRLEELYEVAEQHGLRVVEDAAHAFGCRLDGRLVGSFGDLVCFSFDGIKNITCGEGGAVVTRDKAVAELLRNARLLGVENDSRKRYEGQRSWDFDVTAQGWRYHMSDLMAAIGRVQLRRFPEFAARRVALAKTYDHLLQYTDHVRRLVLNYGPVVPHIYPIRVAAGLRDALRIHLENEGIQTGLHYKPNHLLSFFRQQNVREQARPISEQMFAELVTLPLHTLMSRDDVKLICDSIGRFFNGASE